MHVVHDEGERQDMHKGGYAQRGMYTVSLRVDALGFWGGGGYGRQGLPVAGGGKLEGKLDRSRLDYVRCALV